MTLLTVLFALAAWVHLRADHARNTLAERESQVRMLEEMRHACALGRRPSSAQLATVASLFPGESITCAAIDDALFLTFVSESRAPLAMNHR